MHSSMSEDNRNDSESVSYNTCLLTNLSKNSLYQDYEDYEAYHYTYLKPSLKNKLIWN